MRSHGLSWPYGADFLGSVIANRKDKIELGRTGQGEFIPGLAAQTLGGQARDFELLQSLRSNRA